MRRISRLERSIDLVRARSSLNAASPAFCTACRVQTTSFSTYPTSPAQKVPFTEKVRRRIWGTDKPPGQADPYGEPSFVEKLKQQRTSEREFQERQEAQAARTVPTDLTGYEPATNWDGLERVGGYGNWWKENWDPEHTFVGFAIETVTDPSKATAQLHRAVIEAFALQQAGLSLSDISRLHTEFDATFTTEIVASPNGPALQFQSGSSVEDVLIFSEQKDFDETAEKSNPTPSEEDVAADRSIADPLHPEVTPPKNDEPVRERNPTESEEDIIADREEIDRTKETANSAGEVLYDQVVASWNPAWLQVSLEDPELKFAIFKRTVQLTGIRIPDHAIQTSKTVQDFLSHLVKPPKPRKLAEVLAQKEELLTLPNVNVYSRRITPIDQERSLGRWKVIEKELEARGLPVTGN
ncbi:ribosomal subunit 39S-domain-containing protein [Xylogone sp. PMI_703]|nr:ribosomal subunit 39S-domain-containing protein [Xylogone sp. PMI_703]